MDEIKNNILSAIDVGTNSIHLITAKIDGDQFTIIDRSKEVVRLGEDSPNMKYMSAEAMERGITALKRFKAMADLSNGSIRAVATSAVREALNKDEFLSRVKKETGINIEIISGYEEARLIYLGVLQSLPVFRKHVLVIDIGGGSTEFIYGKEGNIYSVESLKIGAVRYTYEFFPDGKISKESIKECRKSIRGITFPIVRFLKDKNIEQYIGTSGTINNIVSIIKEFDYDGSEQLSNNCTFTKQELDRVINVLLSCKNSLKDSKIKGLDPERCDIIIAGVLILEQLFLELNIEEMTYSDYALREGVLLDSIHKVSGENKLVGLSDIRYKSFRYLMKLYNVEKSHAVQVRKIALQLFDSMVELHKLDSVDREYLEAACLVHDIGYYISSSKHHHHSYYIIRNAEILGFSDREIEIIANIAKYHRKGRPKLKHESFAKLSKKDQLKVEKMASLIQIADGLDKSHDSAILNVDTIISGEYIIFQIETKSGIDVTLDIWGAERKSELFEEVYGYKVKFNVK